MCGFATIHTSGKSVSERNIVIDNMIKSIKHRGPDGNGKIEVSDQVIMGHCRLSVIDIENGSQPMKSLDGRFSLVFNGEIYNYIELGNHLKKSGINLITNSDTEVLLQLLIKEGIDGISKLNGMFSFIFHDRKNNSWIAARDQVGIKPLYYTQTEDELIFASEIKAFFEHPHINAKRSQKSLQQYLSFQLCLDDHTLFKGIKKIKPGHYFKGTGNKITSKNCYWNPSYKINNELTENQFIEKLRYLLSDTINLQVRSDVPLGGYLSGGIDSSLICALANEKINNPIPVFHGKFEEGPAYDESKYAKELVDYVNGCLFEAIPTGEDFVTQLPMLINSLDEPLAGPGLYPQYVVSKLAKEHVTVVLGGQGGDEIFGGYARYLIAYLEQALKGAIFETQEEGKHLVTLDSIVPNLAILKNYKPLITHFFSKSIFSSMDVRYFHLIDRSQGIKSLLNKEMLDNFDFDELFTDFQKIFNHPDTLSYINKMTHFDQKTLLPALLQIEDRVSMSVSLESRVPLLDTRIIDLITSIPPPMKFQGGKTKNILKKAIRGIIPDSIIDRKDKMGFPVPLKEWMDGGIVRDFISDTLLSSKSINRGIYTSAALNQMIQDQGVGARQLWGALSLELWHNNYIDK